MDEFDSILIFIDEDHNIFLHCNNIRFSYHDGWHLLFYFNEYCVGSILDSCVHGISFFLNGDPKFYYCRMHLLDLVADGIIPIVH